MHRIQPRLVTSLALLCLTLVLGVAIVTTRHNPLAWLDQTVLEEMIDHRSPGLTTAVADVTNLFSPLWVFIWTIVAAAALSLHDKNLRRAAAVVASVGIAVAIGAVLKLVFDRPRPPFVDQAVAYEASHSFPSGHVTGTTALMVALALTLTTTATRALRWTAVAAALGISVLAATTRLYLGVHWFTDVLAAIALSISVALVVPLMIEHLIDRIAPLAPKPMRRNLAHNNPPHAHQSEGSRHAASPSK